jgi:hypothetical protein
VVFIVYLLSEQGTEARGGERGEVICMIGSGRNKQRMKNKLL